jgi:hypothetical protein
MSDEPNWGEDPVVMTAEDIDRITEITMKHREALVSDIIENRHFRGREAYAVGTALAILFASSMTEDAAQQNDQARSTTEIMAQWTSHSIPWRVVPIEH